MFEQTGPRFLANWLNHDQNFLKKAREKQKLRTSPKIGSEKKSNNNKKERKKGKERGNKVK